LGYGWNHIWEIQLARAADGTITVRQGNGITRVFQPDSRNSAYFSSKGDSARLRATAGNTYTLTEFDGTAFVFNQQGVLQRTQHRNGETVQLQYASGRLTGLTHSNGSTLTLTYNGSGLISKVQDSQGNSVSYSYDANKRLVAVTDPQNRTVQYSYAASGDPRQQHALTGILLPGNIQQSFTYDAQGRLNSSSNALGTSTFAYHQGELKAVDPENHSTAVSFDNYGVLCRVVDPDGGVTTLSHDAALNNTIIQSPDGSRLVSSYAQDGSIKELTRQNGGKWSFRNGPYGQLAGITTPAGRSTSMQYDSKGNLVRLNHPDGNFSTFEYDPSGRLTSQALPGGITETITYNSAGLPLNMSYADGSSRSFTYSADNKLLTATNAEGTTRFEYDDKDNLVKVTYPNSLYLEYGYDSAGRPVSATDHNGRTSRYSYNAAGLLYQLLDESGSELVRYTYDGVGRVSEKRFSTGARTTYERDGGGRVTRQTTYSPQGSVLAGFDVTYDRNGLPATYTTGQGEFVYTHDIAGNLQQVDFYPLDGPVESTRYERNADGLITRVTVAGATSPVSSNELGNYTQAGDSSVNYNAAGNITSRTANGVSSNYGYDSTGRLVSMETQGSEYRMKYDALGTPIELTTPDRTLKYLYGQRYLPHLFGEYAGSGEAVRTYRYGLEMAVVEFEGTRYFPEFDPLKGETVLSMSAAAAAQQLKALASPMLYLPFQPPYQFADPLIPGPVYFGTAMEGYMTLARDAYKTGGEVWEWAADGGGMDRTIGRLSGNWYYGFGVSVAAIPNAINTVNDALKAFGPFHFVVEGGGTWGRKGLDFFAKSPGLARGLGALSVIVGGVEAIDGISETWEQGNSVDVKDVLNFWSGSTSGPSSKIRHGLASASLAGIGLALVGAPALTVAAPVAAVAAVAALISDNTASLQESFWIWWDGLDVTGETIRGTRMSGSGDPNQKLGIKGYGEENYVAADTPLTYRIDFENRPEATAPAQVVIIRDQLPDEVDWGSFELLELGFGDISIPVDPGTQYFESVVDYAYQDFEYEFNVEVHIEVSIEDGAVFAIFYAIDPATGLPPTVDIGFLPPEPEKVPDTYVPGEGRGQGHITYAVRPRGDLPSGTPIRNVATIQFDFSLDIDTNQIDPMDPSKGTDPDKEALVTIDSDVPTAAVEALPEISPARFLVNWGGDSASGMRSYDVYVRANAGAWSPWFIGTSRTSALFTGDPYVIYDFYAVGINNVGTEAPYSPVIQAFTTAGVDAVDVLIERTPDRKVKLTWTGYSGFGYQIQSSTDQATWFNVGPAQQVGLDGEQLSYTDPAYSFATNKFYRIIVSAN
jgi:YD repeat-containing protein